MRALLVLVLTALAACGGETTAPEQEQSAVLGEFEYLLDGAEGREVPTVVARIPCESGDSAELTLRSANFELSFATPDSSHGDASLSVSARESGCNGDTRPFTIGNEGTWKEVNWDSLAFDWEHSDIRFMDPDVNTNNDHFLGGGLLTWLGGRMYWRAPLSSVSMPDTTVKVWTAFLPVP